MDELVAIYINDIKHSLLSAEDEWALARAARTGCKKSRDELIRHNLLLVVSIAKTCCGYGVPLTDLIQEGNLGLMRAIEKFEPERGYRLSTYASWWILQSVIRAIANGARAIRLPVHVFERRRRCRKLCNMYIAEHGEPPTSEQLAGLMNAKKSLEHNKGHFETVASVEKLLALGDVASLDEPLTRSVMSDGGGRFHASGHRLSRGEARRCGSA